MCTVQVNMGGLLAWEFLLMHWVEVRRWQDYKNFGSVNEVRCPSPLFPCNAQFLKYPAILQVCVTSAKESACQLVEHC